MRLVSAKWAKCVKTVNKIEKGIDGKSVPELEKKRCKLRAAMSPGAWLVVGSRKAQAAAASCAGLGAGTRVAAGKPYALAWVGCREDACGACGHVKLLLGNIWMSVRRAEQQAAANKTEKNGIVGPRWSRVNWG